MAKATTRGSHFTVFWVEVLGYHKLTQNEELYFHDVFKLISSLLPSLDIFNKAIEIRMDLPGVNRLLAAKGF